MAHLFQIETAASLPFDQVPDVRACMRACRLRMSPCLESQMYPTLSPNLTQRKKRSGGHMDQCPAPCMCSGHFWFSLPDVLSMT